MDNEFDTQWLVEYIPNEDVIRGRLIWQETIATGSKLDVMNWLKKRKIGVFLIQRWA